MRNGRPGPARYPVAERGTDVACSHPSLFCGLGDLGDTQPSTAPSGWLWGLTAVLELWCPR